MAGDHGRRSAVGLSQAVDVEVLVVGAGISGIGAGISLLRQGWTSVVILESGAELGGTWRDNTYPGVAVDIPSSSYCFSFSLASFVCFLVCSMFSC